MIWSNNFVNIQLSCHCIWNVQKDTSEHFTICKSPVQIKALFSNPWVLKEPWLLLSQSSCSCCRISWRVTAQEPPALALCWGILANLGQNVILQSIDAFQKHRMITILQFYEAPRHLHFLWNTWFGTFQGFFITEHTPLLHIHNRRIWSSSSFFFFFRFFL